MEWMTNILTNKCLNYYVHKPLVSNIIHTTEPLLNIAPDTISHESDWRASNFNWIHKNKRRQSVRRQKSRSALPDADWQMKSFLPLTLHRARIERLLYTTYMLERRISRIVRSSLLGDRHVHVLPRNNRPLRHQL
jgi:hypothetical protein